jgi:hypothetical protein
VVAAAIVVLLLSPSGSTASSPKAVAQSLFNALAQHDRGTVCQLLTPEAAKAQAEQAAIMSGQSPRGADAAGCVNALGDTFNAESGFLDSFQDAKVETVQPNGSFATVLSSKGPLSLRKVRDQWKVDEQDLSRLIEGR